MNTSTVNIMTTTIAVVAAMTIITTTSILVAVAKTTITTTSILVAVAMTTIMTTLTPMTMQAALAAVATTMARRKTKGLASNLAASSTCLRSKFGPS